MSPEKPPKLRAAPGRRVRHRDGRLFLAEGERVALVPFYARLLAAGDLEPVESGRSGPKRAPKKPEGKLA